MAEANQNVLYVDEVNLLPDHLVDDLLDAAATKVNVVEREGISVAHPSDFVLIGTMNPEEGELRPQLLDRFPTHVAVGRHLTVEQRMELVRRNLAFEDDPEMFREEWAAAQTELRERIVRARELLPEVVLSRSRLRAIAMACDALEVDGVRPDIVISKVAMTHSAFSGRTEVTLEDMQLGARLALSHRTRRGGLLEPPSPQEIQEAITKAVSISEKRDRRKSPTESPSESSDITGPRLSGGRFGRQSRVVETDMADGKKKAPRG